MNLNDLHFNNANNRNKRKFLRIVKLQNGIVAATDKKRKSSASASVTKSNEDGNGSHCSVTATSNATSTSADDGGIVIAITEGRGDASCEVGMSAMSTQQPELTLFQISDTNSFLKVLHKIQLLNPNEILVPITMAESRLVKTLKHTFPCVKIIGVDRSAFRKDSGLQFVKNCCAPYYNSVYLVLLHKYYALAATGALRVYLETYKHLYYAKETLKINYHESDFNTMIDIFTADKLELVACALGNTHNSSNKRHSSLRGILNHCLTKLGSRMLRSNILQPPNRQEEIEARLDCVEELVKSPERLLGLREILKKLSSFGQVLSIASLLRTNAQYCDERHMNYVLQLNSFFDEMEPLKELLASSVAPFFHQVHSALDCDEFRTLDRLFKFVIHEDARPAFGAQAKAARCFAIKNGQSEILDILRKKYSDRLDDMTNHVNEVARQLGYDFKLSNNAKKGYHIALQFGPKQRHGFKKSSLPPDFCQIHVMSTMVTMKTIKLITLANRLEDTGTEMLRISNVIVHELLLKVQTRLSQFYFVCEHLAKLDVVQSLAQATSCGTRYVRPKFNVFTRVVNGRHPLLDYLLESDPVSNNIVVTPENRLHLITGPNGSGKSIYIRQIVLLQIMAQLGCYVPATKATFKICDRILARIYFEDNMECDASAFTLEMKEIAYFFNVITDRTLIIIDELCRSTAVREGTALAMSICEHLMNTQAFVYFTTHYTYITKLQQYYPSIRCWKLETKEIYRANSKPRLQFTYKVVPGVITLEGYGIALARSIWPDNVTNDVDQLLPKIIDKSMETSIDKRVALKINLENDLQELSLQGKCFKHVVYQKCLEYQEELRKLDININLYEDADEEEEGPSTNTNEHEEPILAEAVYSRSDIEVDVEVEVDKTNVSSSLSTSKCTETSYMLYARKRNERAEIRNISNSIVNSTFHEFEAQSLEAKQTTDEESLLFNGNLNSDMLKSTTPFAICGNQNVFDCIKSEVNEIEHSETVGNWLSLNSNSFHKQSIFNQNITPSSSSDLGSDSQHHFKGNALSFDTLKMKNQKGETFGDFSKSFPTFEENNQLNIGLNSTFTLGVTNNGKFGIEFGPNSGQDEESPFENVSRRKSIDQINICPNIVSGNLCNRLQTVGKIGRNASTSSVTSSHFLIGLNRENASTPLVTTRKPTYDNEELLMVDAKRPKLNSKWTDRSVFNDDADMRDALELIELENKSAEKETLSTESDQLLRTHLNKNVCTSATGTTSTNAMKSTTTSPTTENPFHNAPKKRRLLSSQCLNEAILHSSGSTSNDQQQFEELPKFEFAQASSFKAPVNKSLNKLTKKEIEGFYHQKRLDMFQSMNPDAAEAYCKEMLNRPSAKQIQASEVLLTARQVSNGQFVVDVPRNQSASKLRHSHVRRFEAPFKTDPKFSRNIRFDNTMFSDVNSRAFDKFLESSSNANHQDHAQYVANFEHFKQNIEHNGAGPSSSSSNAKTSKNSYTSSS